MCARTQYPHCSQCRAKLAAAPPGAISLQMSHGEEAAHNDFIVRGDSHSRGAYKTFESIRQKLIDFHKVRRETILGIPGMPESNRSQIIAAAETQYQQMMLSNAIRHNRDKDFRESITALSMLGGCVSKRLRILAALSHIPAGVVLAKMLLRAFRIYDKVKRH